MHVVFSVRGLGSSCTSKHCFISYSFNFVRGAHESKEGHMQTLHLYPLRLGLPFPNDVRNLRPKVGSRPNQMKVDLRKVFMENINFVLV